MEHLAELHLLDLKQGQSAIYRHLSIDNQSIIEDILTEVHKGNLDRCKIQNAVDAIRRTLRHLQSKGIPIDDSEIEKALEDICMSVNSDLNLEQQFELSIPIIPFLLTYKLGLAADVDLGAVWQELRETQE